MSNKLDWSQFEAVDSPSAAKSADWDQFEPVEREPFKIGRRPTGPSQLPAMKRQIGMDLKTIGSTLAGTPGDLVSSLGQGINWIAGKVPFGKPKTEEELAPLTKNPFTSDSIKKKVEEFAPDLAPKNEEEANRDHILSTVTSLLTPIPVGKGKAFDPRTTKGIYKVGKELGLTAKELTPLIQSEAKTAILGKFAKRTKQFEKSIAATENALSDVYSGIKTSAEKLPKFNYKITDDLIEKFHGIKSSLERTLAPSPDKKSAIEFIEKAIHQADNHGTSPAELVNFFQDINRAVNWNAIKGGKKVLGEMKEPIIQAIAHADPKLARDFTNTNMMWSKLKSFEKQVGLPKIQKYIDYGEVPAFLTAFAFGNLGGIAKVGGTIAARRLASRMLTDPNWQNLHFKALNSIKNHSPKSAHIILQELKKKTKSEMPEEYEEIEWPSS